MTYEIGFPGRGFLPKNDPPTELTMNDEIDIMGFANSIPFMLKSQDLRREVKKLPVVDYSHIGNGDDLNLLMRSYSFLASAYVYADPENPEKVIPKSIAIPLTQIADKLQREPILSYASYCLFNWERIDPNYPIELGNIKLQQNFLDNTNYENKFPLESKDVSDEDGFVLVHVDIEARAEEVVEGIESLRKRKEYGNFEHGLLKISRGLSKINETMDKMDEWCSPENYWNRVRPYIFSFQNVVYEGVSNEERNYNGETGAQSSILPSIDAKLGIKFKKSELQEYRKIMRRYMPKDHRDYISTLENEKNIRDEIFDLEVPEELKDSYNKAVTELYNFRVRHCGFAERYILEKNQGPIGTGGSNLVSFLWGMAEETKEHILE